MNEWKQTEWNRLFSTWLRYTFLLYDYNTKDKIFVWNLGSLLKSSKVPYPKTTLGLFFKKILAF